MKTVNLKVMYYFATVPRYAVRYVSNVDCPNVQDEGDQIPVTEDNREEFVSLYLDYVINKAVSDRLKLFNDTGRKT